MAIVVVEDNSDIAGNWGRGLEVAKKGSGRHIFYEGSGLVGEGQQSRRHERA